MTITKSSQTLLFQGDSITDCGRDRTLTASNQSTALGNGYAFLVASRVLSEDPTISVFNRGISGNRIPDLQQRWQQDCIALKPSLLSILIGVNDMWHGMQGRYAGSTDDFERGYRELLLHTRTQLPDTRLVLCEPFVARCGAVTSDWFPEFDRRREMVRKLAGEHEATFVEFQRVVDEACQRAPATYWAADGVHPTLAGHYLLAQAWYRAAYG